MTKYFLILLLMACIGCSKRNKIEETHNAIGIYPLNLGASWTLISYPYQLSLHVDSIVEIGTNKFARLTETSVKIGSSDVIKRTLYFADDESKNTKRFYSKISSLNRNDADSFISTWYKYDARVGESWIARSNSYFNSKSSTHYRISLLSRSDTVVSDTRTYLHCYKFFIDDLYESDSEYYDWVCPGIGLVKRAFNGDMNKAFILKNYSL